MLHRIAVVGAGGAGKSTFAGRLGSSLGLPVVDLDRAFAGVVFAQRASIVAALVAGDRWIADGDHLPTQPLRFAAADVVVFLDLPTSVCLWRLARRALANRGARRAHAAPDRGLGSRWQTAAWVLRYRSRTRPLVMRNLAEHARVARIAVARSSAETASLLAELSEARVDSRSIGEEST